MAYRILIFVLALMGAGTAYAQGVTVYVCYSEFPDGTSCSFTEAPFHRPTLEGPAPSSGSRTPEPFQFGDPYHRFVNIPPGEYIVRDDGRCNPFGCFFDTPVSVADTDVTVRVRQVRLEQSPSPTAQSPSPTPTSAPCLGDEDGDRRVTIDELVRAVGNALNGCP